MSFCLNGKSWRIYHNPYFQTEILCHNKRSSLKCLPEGEWALSFFPLPSLVYVYVGICQKFLDFSDTDISLAQASLRMWSNWARLPMIPFLLRVYFCVSLIAEPYVLSLPCGGISVICVWPNHLGVSIKVAVWTLIKPAQSESLHVGPR